MKTILASETMEIPEEVTVKVSAKMISVTGPCGTLTRNFKHLNLDFPLQDGGRKLKVDAWFGTRRTMAAIRTAISHIQNLITGVRKVDVLDGVTILRSEKVKDEIVLDDSDIELVSRSAALINQNDPSSSIREGGHAVFMASYVGVPRL
ncbi:60S ribosomal protein L9 [Hordeum vulgare]|nr:60S ribosomal protein L9 [Hordeum vulgare]